MYNLFTKFILVAHKDYRYFCDGFLFDEVQIRDCMRSLSEHEV